MPLPNLRGLNFLRLGRNEAEQVRMERPAGRFWTTNVPSVATSGTDDSMDGMETHSASDCVPSVPRTAHNSQQQSGSESYGIEEGHGALSLVAENGSLRSDLSSDTQRTFHDNRIPFYGAMPLRRWVHSPERHEVIACGIRNGTPEDLPHLIESLRLLLSQMDPNVDPHSALIFEPQAGFGPRQLELRTYSKPKVSFVGLPDIPRILSDDSSQVADLDPEDNFENITETHRENFRESLSNLAANDQVLADRLIHRLGAEVNLILPLFDGRGLDALLLPEHSGNTEHAQHSKPAQSAGYTVPNSRVCTSKGRTQGASKRSRDTERDDNGKDQNSKRNKKDPPSSPPTPPPKKAVMPRFKCPFCAKCCITHCRKNGRLSTSQGYALIHHILDHFKEYHIVVRCQRCYTTFEGPTAVSSKNDHQRMCNTTKPPIADDVIDCDMKAKLDEKLRFRTWTLENENDPDMKSWILRNVATLSGITRLKLELTDGELKTLSFCERELAKWYTIWKTLFEGLPVPSHPFHEPNVSQAVQNRQRFQFLFRNVVNAIADERGPPPANDFQGQTEWFFNCLSVTLGLLVSPSSENTSAQGEGSSSQEQLLSFVSSAIDMQGMMSSLAPQLNGSSSSESVTRDASQDQQTPRHLVRRPPIPDATVEHLQLSQNPSSISNTTAGYSLSESQDPEAVVPNPTQVPDAQTDAGIDSYGRTTYPESQVQGQGQAKNQTSSFGNIGSVCDICFGFLSYLAEGTLQGCPRCTMYTPYNPVVSDNEDLYNA